MKKLKVIIMTLMVLTLVSFGYVDEIENEELYQVTDGFVKSLQTTYESYGMFSEEHTKHTKDGLYKVQPYGRLINVKIKKFVNDNEYEKLKNKLKEHYKNNSNVNDVYICGGGTVMIDCRNNKFVE